MQFNEKYEELGDISMKVLNEAMFGQVVLNPKNKEEDVVQQQPTGDAKEKAIDAITPVWEKVVSGLEAVKRDILGLKGREYAEQVDAAIQNLTKLVDDALIMNGPEKVRPPETAPTPTVA